MCGRYASTADPASLALELDAVDEVPDGLAASWNTAPTDPVLTVVDRHPEPDHAPTRRVRAMRWGLLPHWAKDLRAGAKMINARAETAASTPAFRAAAASRRCLVPADGWFEWRRDGTTKQPYFITPADGSRLYLAGLWSVWWPRGADRDAERPVLSCSIVTTAATGALTDVHHRMPLVLAPADHLRWLDPDAPAPAELLSGVVPTELVDALELRPVGNAVGDVRSSGPRLVARVAPAEPPTLL